MAALPPAQGLALQEEELPGLSISSAELLSCETRAERGEMGPGEVSERRVCVGRQEWMLAEEHGNWGWLGKSLGQVGTSKGVLEMNMGVRGSGDRTSYRRGVRLASEVTNQPEGSTVG